MATMVLSTMGSLGDLHPMIALAIERFVNGRIVDINTWDGYEEKIADLGLEFHSLRPNLTDRTELNRRVMDAVGPEGW